MTLHGTLTEHQRTDKQHTVRSHINKGRRERNVPDGHEIANNLCDWRPQQGTLVFGSRVKRAFVEATAGSIGHLQVIGRTIVSRHLNDNNNNNKFLYSAYHNKPYQCASQ